MIALDVRLPLERFALRVAVTIESRSVAVVGPSGCGKTSLLEALAGLRSRAAGRVQVGQSVLLDSAARICLPPERRRVGYVPQDAGLFPHLDVRANVRFGLRAGADAERRFDESVAILDIAPLLGRYPAKLSGGERQRVALARALATAPRLLLLDEPLAALDAELKGRILPYLLRVRDEARVPLVYVTHHVGEALALTDEAILLKQGRVAAHGPSADVLGAQAVSSLDPAASFENVLSGEIHGIDEDAGIARLRLPDGTILTVPSAAELRAGARASICVGAEEILISRHPLEQVSARNVLAGRVAGLDSVGRDTIARVDAAGLHWRAKITAGAVRELQLSSGTEVWMAIKTHAIRVL